MDILIRMGVCGSVLALGVICFRHFAYYQVPRRFIVLLWLMVSARLLLPFFIPVDLHGLSVAVFGHVLGGGSQTGILQETLQLAERSVFIGGNSQAFDAQAMISPTQAAITIWLAVVLLLIGYMLYSHLRSMRKYSTSLPVTTKETEEWMKSHVSYRKIQIRTSEWTGCPITFGFLKPVILLPAGIKITERDTAYILEHEWIHIKRYDVLTKYLVYFTAAVYWFNPLVWVMVSMVNRDIETACDEEVLRQHHMESRENYARLLVHMSEQRTAVWPIKTGFSGFNEMEERIKSIMRMKKYTWKTTALAAVMLMCTVPAFVASAAPDKQPEENKTQYISYLSDAGSARMSIVTGQQIAELAKKQEGAPYQYGGSDLSQGVDSSGFLKAVYALVGIELPSGMEAQAKSGTAVVQNEIAAGDLVFYGRKNEDNTVSLQHATIYVGNGTVIHASNAREGVKLSVLGYRDIKTIIRVVQ